MTSSLPEKKKKVVEVDLIREDGSYIRVPLVRLGEVNKLLRRVPKRQIKLKNTLGAKISVPTRLVLAITVDGEERWRNETASRA